MMKTPLTISGGTSSVSKMSLAILKSSSVAVGEDLYTSIERPSAPGAFTSFIPLRQASSSSSVRWSSGLTVVSLCMNEDIFGGANFSLRKVFHSVRTVCEQVIRSPFRSIDGIGDYCFDFPPRTFISRMIYLVFPIFSAVSI